MSTGKRLFPASGLHFQICYDDDDDDTVVVLDLEAVGRGCWKQSFATLTNVNFSAACIGELIAESPAFKTEFVCVCASLFVEVT